MTGNGAPVRTRYHPYYRLQRRYNCLRKHRHLFLLKTAGAAATLSHPPPRRGLCQLRTHVWPRGHVWRGPVSFPWRLKLRSPKGSCIVGP